MRRTTEAGALAALASVAAATTAHAEPYLALRNGVACSACHVNVNGGGLRTVFGAGVGRDALPWYRMDEASGLWDGAIGQRVRVGTDVRAAYVGNLRRDEPYLGEYVLSQATLYASFDALPERLQLYIDEQLAGGASSRELFALVRAGPQSLYFKAGRFFPAFGWRLQDDEAFTRLVTGFNFDAADVGLEVGAEPGPWSLALAITNGTAGATESDNGKQVTATAAYVRKHWRFGGSASNNDLPERERRTLAGLFGGFRAGPIVALYELDWIREDPLSGGRTYGIVSHAEVDATPRRGLTLRLWAGHHEPDRDLDGRKLRQIGLGADWTALPGLQVRGLYRRRDGPTDVAGAGDDEARIELHLYF